MSESSAENKLVTCPQKYPVGKNYFNWDNEKLKEWLDCAIKLQESHVKDNNRTRMFKYNQLEDRNELELRVLITVYGLRTPEVSKI
jgi:hypothetical protein